MFASGIALPTSGRASGRCDRLPDLQPGRGQDVPLLAVGVLDQGDVAGPVRVVLDRLDGGRDAVLVPLKSISRYSRLFPPLLPWWVMTPWWLRPLARFWPTVSDFSGLNLVRTAL
jgi:hypothetical protein